MLSKRGRKPTLPLALSTDARCQNRRCLATASRTVELSNELSNLRAEFERRLDRAAAARVKKAEAEAAECKRELEQLRIDERRAHIHRNRSDALVKRVTIKAAAQIDAATRDTAFAKSELASTMRKLLDEKEETRRLRRELGTARAQATKLQSKIQEGERDLDEALDAVAEEEWRAASAVEALQELTRKAEVDAQAARDSILQEMGTATALEEERDSLLYDIKLLDLKLNRLHARNDQLLAPPPAARAASMDERVQHSRDAEKKRRSRRRIWLKGVLKDYKYDMAEVAAVAGDLELTANLFDTKEVFTEHIARVRKLMETVGREHLGQAFALFLHFDMHLPLEKIARVNNAGCMRFHRSSDSYSRIVIAHNPYVKADVVKMPRLTPPRCRLEPLIKTVAETLNLSVEENGRLAIIPFENVVQEMLAQDPGVGDMPTLPFFLGGAINFPINISSDATGFGKQQFNTVIARNPYRSKSAALNRFLGLGNCDDGRSGTKRVLGPNLGKINEYIWAEREGRCVEVAVKADTAAVAAGPDSAAHPVAAAETVAETGDPPAQISPAMYFTNDLSSVRHCEHIANSGLCGCDRDTALRCV